MPLEDIEKEHGFTFGGSDRGANAPATLALVCQNLTCPNRGKHVQLHADTVLPINCGGCGQTLHCDHPSRTPQKRHEGTLSAPVEVTYTICDQCGHEADHQRRELPPFRLEDLPAERLAALFG